VQRGLVAAFAWGEGKNLGALEPYSRYAARADERAFADGQDKGRVMRKEKFGGKQMFEQITKKEQKAREKSKNLRVSETADEEYMKKDTRGVSRMKKKQCEPLVVRMR